MDQRLSDASAALRTLDDDVKSDRDLLSLLDNFEVIASAFDALLFPRRSSLRRLIKKPKPLHAVLWAIAKTRDAGEQAELKKLAKAVKGKTKEIRQADYGGFDFDTSDLLSEANDLRADVKDALARLLPDPEPPDDAEENELE